MLPIIVFCVVSYFIGSLPFGLWVGLLWKQVDIRTLGSKNIGATNVLRVLGPGPGITVFALDTLKGVAGIVLAHLLGPTLPVWAYILIGLCAILGHTFSIFLRFKGGKGVATSFGVLMAVSPLMAGVTLAVWGVFVLLTRYVSLASIAAAVSLPITAFFGIHNEGRWWLFGLGLTLALLVTVKHRANIHRLLTGTESKIGQRVSTTPADTEVQ